MKKTRVLFLIFLLLAGSAAGAVRAQAAEIVERILAVVNDEIITDADLDLVIAPVVAQMRTLYTGDELDARIGSAKKEFLNKLIEDKLILSEAKRKQVIVKDSEVDDMMTEVRNKFPDRDQFLKALDDQGLTEKKLWNRFHDQVMTQKYVSFEVRSKVSVSPGEIAEYYKAHEADFEQGDRVKLEQILVRVGSRTDEDAKAFADNLATQIKGGKSFEDLAKSYSEGTEAKDGGDMGWIEKGQLLGDIDEKIFSISPGEITSPIKSALGYHIFKVLDRQQAAPRPLADARNEIQDLIYKEKVKKKLEVWIAGLRKNAYISIRP